MRPSSLSSQGSSQPLRPGVIAGIVLAVVGVMAILSILLLRLRTTNKTSQGVVEPFNPKVHVEVNRSTGDRDNNFGMFVNPRLARTEHMERDPMFNGSPESPPPYSLLYDSQSTASHTGAITSPVEVRASTVTSQVWSSPKRIM